MLKAYWAYDFTCDRTQEAKLRDKGFSALLEIRAESMATRFEIDAVFRRLLQEIDATNVTEIEPYD